MTRGSMIRRVLVALDCSPGSLAALDAAAAVAAAIDAELLGLFVEDVELLHGAGHPAARQISSFSGALTPLDAEQMRLQLRTLAARARAALAAAGRRSGVRSSFEVRRGAVSAVLLEELTESDVVSVGYVGWSARGKDRLGTTARQVLESARASALLARRAGVFGSSVWTVFDGSPEARHALDVGADEKTRARVAGEVATETEAKGRPPRLHDSATARASEALAALRGEAIGLLVLPANVAGQAGDALPATLAGIDCPVLIVRDAARPKRPER